MAGISRIKDIFLPNGKLKPWNFFSDKGLNLNNYFLILGEIRVHPTARLKYNSIYNDQVFNWKQIYLIPHKVTLDIRTRIFQYKLLNRIVYTNKLLHKIKLLDTSLCMFCGEYEESLEHLFLHCRFSKNFWMQIVSWLNDLNIAIIELKDSEIMLGYTNESPHWILLNHILII